MAQREALRLRRHGALVLLVALGFWMPGTYFMRGVVPQLAPLTASELVRMLYALLPLVVRPELAMALLLGSIQFAAGTWRAEREDLCTTALTPSEIAGGKVLAPCLLLAGLNAMMAVPNYAALFTDPTMITRTVPDRYWGAAATTALALAEDFAFSFLCVLTVYRELVRTPDRMVAAMRAIATVLAFGVVAGTWAGVSTGLAAGFLLDVFRNEALFFVVLMMVFVLPVLALEAVAIRFLWAGLRRDYFDLECR